MSMIFSPFFLVLLFSLEAHKRGSVAPAEKELAEIRVRGAIGLHKRGQKLRSNSVLTTLRTTAVFATVVVKHETS